MLYFLKVKRAHTSVISP